MSRRILMVIVMSIFCFSILLRGQTIDANDKATLITALNDICPTGTIYITDNINIDASQINSTTLNNSQTGAIFNVIKPCTINGNGYTISISVEGFGIKYSLFKIRADDVRITNLNLKGPNETIGSYSSSATNEQNTYCDGDNRGILCYAENLEVDHCEIYGWIHAGILLGSGSLNANIHNNSFHHNQHYGLGYSVATNKTYTNGGVASGNINVNIDSCKFDWGRHAIAGDGYSGESYTARNNIFYPNFYLHTLDMHGAGDHDDTSDITRAGTKVKIENNIIHARSNLVRGETDLFDNREIHKRMGICIRGVPEDSCIIKNNWFTGTIPQYSIAKKEYSAVDTYVYKYYDDLSDFTISSNNFNSTDIICYSQDGEGSSNDNKLSIWNQNVSGVDTEYRNVYSNSSHPFNLMTTGDFDKDGIEEVALYRTYDGKITIYNVNYPNDPNDNSELDSSDSENIYTQNQNFTCMTNLDYDDNGFDNEIVMYDSVQNKILVYNKDSGYNHIIQWTPSKNSGYTNLITGDFNKDGKDEIGLYKTNTLDFYSISGNDSASWSIGYDFDYICSIDWDNDGYNNEVVFYAKNASSKKNYIEVYRYHETLGYEQPFAAESNSYYTFKQMIAGDFDNDGCDEIALYRYVVHDTSDNDSRITVYNISRRDDKYVNDGELSGSDGYSIIMDSSVENNCVAPIVWDRGNSLGEHSFASNKKLIDQKEISQLPSKYKLYANYPNPFNPSTTISYNIPENCLVKLSVYNIMGKKIKTLTNGYASAGYKSIIWNATNDKNKQVSSGVYILKMNTSTGINKTMKMMFLK